MVSLMASLAASFQLTVNPRLSSHSLIRSPREVDFSRKAWMMKTNAWPYLSTAVSKKKNFFQSNIKSSESSLNNPSKFWMHRAFKTIFTWTWLTGRHKMCLLSALVLASTFGLQWIAKWQSSVILALIIALLACSGHEMDRYLLWALILEIYKFGTLQKTKLWRRSEVMRVVSAPWPGITHS